MIIIKSKIIKVIGKTLKWLFYLLILIIILTILFYRIEQKWFMTDLKADTVKIINKKHHVYSRAMDGQDYEEFTEYSIRFPNNGINSIRISGFNNYKPGTKIEISYRKSNLTNMIQLINYNVKEYIDKDMINDDSRKPFKDEKSVK